MGEGALTQTFLGNNINNKENTMLNILINYFENRKIRKSKLAVQAKKTLRIKAAREAVCKMPLFDIIYNTDTQVPKKIALAKLKAERDQDLCIQQGICPICGKLMLEDSWDNGDDNHPEDYKLSWCSICLKRTKIKETLWF